AVEADGSIIVAGAGGLVRLTRRGAPAGEARTPADVAALAAYPGGDVIAAYTDHTDPRPTLAVIRLRADLAVDPAFNRGRAARIDFPDGARASAVAVAPGGDLVVGALTGSGKLALVRLLADGSLDIGFGDHGATITPLAHRATALA